MALSRPPYRRRHAGRLGSWSVDLAPHHGLVGLEPYAPTYEVGWETKVELVSLCLRSIGC